jgi:hypothetical protein
MRDLRTLAGTGIVAAALLAGCGGRDAVAGAGDGPARTCAALDRLAATGEPVEQADVADPDAFTETLERAADAYVGALDDLREVAPERLHATIDDLARAVERGDLDRARTVRAPLDAYAVQECVPLASPPSS